MTVLSETPVAEPRKTRESVPGGDVPGVTRPMTYEEYLATPEEMARFDILDGWKVYRRYGEKQLTNPTREHQRILRRIARTMEDYEEHTQRGQVIVAPCDVLILSDPLRKRQPDLLFISSERLAQNPPETDPSPLSPAPELVVEIVSPSDKPSVLAAKIADYRIAGVGEVWIARSEPQTLEVVRLTTEEIETVATYERGQTVVSLSFPDLTVAVDDIYAE
jgi:Uma2 family endonuclease